MQLAVLTVSDRCARGLAEDTAGPAVAEILRKNWPHAEIVTALLADEEDLIVPQLNQWVEGGVALVLTVGGTGLGPRDRTPEATNRVIDREATGLAEAMRSCGARKNAFAWLSRGVAGLARNTLILNLPGSKRGAEESLECVLALLGHALDVMSGGQVHP